MAHLMKLIKLISKFCQQLKIEVYRYSSNCCTVLPTSITTVFNKLNNRITLIKVFPSNSNPNNVRQVVSPMPHLFPRLIIAHNQPSSLCASYRDPKTFQTCHHQTVHHQQTRNGPRGSIFQRPNIVGPL